jgi:hypothetical protein
MTDEQTVFVLQSKVARGAILTGDEDYRLEVARERLNKTSGWRKIDKKASRIVGNPELLKRAREFVDTISKENVTGYVPPFVHNAHKCLGKAHDFFSRAAARRPDVQPLEAGNTHLAAALDGLGKLCRKSSDMSPEMERELRRLHKGLKVAEGHYDKAAKRLVGDGDFDNGRDHFGAGMQHLKMSKIDFEGYEPAGSNLLPRDVTTEGVRPAAMRSKEMASNKESTHATVPSREAIAKAYGGSALINGAGLVATNHFVTQETRKNMVPDFAPWHAEGQNPAMPGHALDPATDAGGNLTPQEALRRLGPSPSPAELAHMGERLRQRGDINPW